MNDFFNSKFIDDLGQGKLPPVEVEVTVETLVQIGITVILSAVIIMLIGKIFKNF